MKTTLISVLTALLLGLASQASGRSFDAASLVSILFTTGLVAWTAAQYGRPPRALLLDRPLRFPAKASAGRSPAPAHRLAA